MPGLPRLRLSSIDQVEADPALMQAIATEPRLMPHLHLSLQAGDDLILKRMKRRHSRDDAIRFCAEARALRPDLVLGADIIAGFPTETEGCSPARSRSWRNAGSPGCTSSPSARAPAPPPRACRRSTADIRERAARLRALGASQVAAHLAAMQGKAVRLLMERPELGRTEGFALARVTSALTPGEVVAARVAGRSGEALLAEAA